MIEISNGKNPQNVRIPKDIPVDSFFTMKDTYPNSIDTISQYVFNNDLLKELSGL
jgi:hypothetical protein